jgi:hypothetical protein
MTEVISIVGIGLIHLAVPILLFLNHHEPDYARLIEQCRRQRTHATVQHVYDATHDVTATEAICSLHDLKVNNGTVVTFEMPVNKP